MELKDLKVALCVADSVQRPPRPAGLQASLSIPEGCRFVQTQPAAAEAEVSFSDVFRCFSCKAILRRCLRVKIEPVQTNLERVSGVSAGQTCSLPQWEEALALPGGVVT